MKPTTLLAIIGNVVALLANWLIQYGVTLTPEQQATLAGALLAIVNTAALVIPAIVAWRKNRAAANGADPAKVNAPMNQGGYVRPSLLWALFAATAVLLVTLSGCATTGQPQLTQAQLDKIDTALQTFDKLIDVLAVPDASSGPVLTYPAEPVPGGPAQVTVPAPLPVPAGS